VEGLDNKAEDLIKFQKKQFSTSVSLKLYVFSLRSRRVSSAFHQQKIHISKRKYITFNGTVDVMVWTMRLRLKIIRMEKVECCLSDGRAIFGPFF